MELLKDSNNHVPSHETKRTYAQHDALCCARDTWNELT